MDQNFFKKSYRTYYFYWILSFVFVHLFSLDTALIVWHMQLFIASYRFIANKLNVIKQKLRTY